MMNKRKLRIALILVVLGVNIGNAQNPIVQTNFTPDPAPMVYNDRVYVYTGQDEDGATGRFVMNNWRVYSSLDMVNWTDHGSPLSYKTFNWATGDAWAAHCIHRNGKFYWYVTVSDKNTHAAAVGVAVSDTPTGPFEDALGKPLIGKTFGEIDPSVFIDDDGKAYLYWGNPELWYVELNEDMISYKGELHKVELTKEGFGANHPSRFTSYEEGSWLYKRNMLYYLVYAAGGVPENISYSTSYTPIGPWTYRGVIMPVQGNSFTIHPGIIDFKGNHYFFYHNGALPGGGGFMRSTCVEQFNFNPDGSIPEINMTKEGVRSVGNLNPYCRVEAETIAWSEGVKANENETAGVYVTSIHNGDYIKVRNIDFGAESPTLFTASVAGKTKRASIELRLDSMDGPILGTLNLSATGGWNKWKTESTKVGRVIGVHDLYLTFRGNTDEELLNFDYWTFSQDNK